VKILARTRRLVLREILDADEEPLARCFADPATMAFYPATWDRKFTREWMTAQRESYAARGYGLWAACDKESGEFRGYCGLAAPEVGEDAEVEIGYLIRREDWNRGLATEAARAALRLCRRRFGRPDPIALVDEGNAASIRVAEKIGMRWERDARLGDRRLRLYRFPAGGKPKRGRRVRSAPSRPSATAPPRSPPAPAGPPRRIGRAPGNRGPGRRAGSSR
jgi:RimJ/RimL family protein N-acetyltransferase